MRYQWVTKGMFKENKIQRIEFFIQSVTLQQQIQIFILKGQKNKINEENSRSSAVFKQIFSEVDPGGTK